MAAEGLWCCGRGGGARGGGGGGGVAAGEKGRGNAYHAAGGDFSEERC